MILLKKFGITCFIIALLCIGCGGSVPLSIIHIVERPPHFRMDSIKSITIGKVNEEGKRFDQNEVLRSLVMERFAQNSYYTMYDAATDQTIDKSNVILTITILSNEFTVLRDTLKKRIPKKNADKNGRRTDSIVKTPVKSAVGELSVSCRVVNSQTRVILAVREFTEKVTKSLKNDEELSNSLKRTIEKEELDNVASQIRNWLLPYTDMLAFNLFENEESSVFKEMSGLIIKRDYASAIELLKKETQTLKNDDPNLPLLLYNLGCLQLHENMYEESVSSFEHALLRGSGEKIYKDKLNLVQTLIAERKVLQARRTIK